MQQTLVDVKYLMQNNIYTPLYWNSLSEIELRASTVFAVSYIIMYNVSHTYNS